MRQLLMRRPHLRGLPPLASPTPGYHLALAGIEDAFTIAQCLKNAFGVDWSPDRVLRDLLEAEEVLATYIVRYEGRCVATASARLIPSVFPGSGYLHWVATHPAHRGKRLGEWVSLRVLYLFAEKNCRDAVLETDDFRLPAIKTYLRLGFLPEYDHPSHPSRWRKVFEALGVGISPLVVTGDMG